MKKVQRWFLAFNAAGGLLVLGSYALGILTHEAPADTLWGATPAEVRPWYTVSMLLAAAGYFAFLQHLLFRVDPSRVALPGGFATLFVVFALILIPSALWMPLTFHHAESATACGWWAVRSVLFIVALGSLALTGCLLFIRPSPATISWLLAVAGAAIFAFHTTFLDALLWPVLFKG